MTGLAWAGAVVATAGVWWLCWSVGFRVGDALGRKWGPE